MGTCYYLQREDGKLFDLDKAYGLSHYIRSNSTERSEADGGGFPWSPGDLNALVSVLAEFQKFPCCGHRTAWAQRMIDFAQDKPVVLYADHEVPESDDEYGRAGYLDRVIGERWDKPASEHVRSCPEAQ